MIKVYGYLPGWTVPCISPYVTKAIYYMKMAGIEHEFVNQDLTQARPGYAARQAADDRGWR